MSVFPKVALDLLMGVPLNSVLVCLNQWLVCGRPFLPGEFSDRVCVLSALSVLGVPVVLFNFIAVRVDHRALVLGLSGVLFSGLVSGRLPLE